MLKKLLLAAAVLTMSLASPAIAVETYVVATDCTFPPMEYLDDNKQPTGFDPALMKEIGKACGFEVDVRNIAWDGIFAGVAAGNYDIVAAAVSITPERARAFDISDPYFDVHPTILAPMDSTMTRPEELKGLKVGGQIGNSSLMALEKLDTGCSIKEYDDVGLAIEDMMQGRIDAVSLDSPVAFYYLNKKAEYADKMRVAMQFGEPEHYGLVVKKGNKELLDKLNEGIRLVRESGAYDRVFAEHIGKAE